MCPKICQFAPFERSARVFAILVPFFPRCFPTLFSMYDVCFYHVCSFSADARCYIPFRHRAHLFPFPPFPPLDSVFNPPAALFIPRFSDVHWTLAVPLAYSTRIPCSSIVKNRSSCPVEALHL